MTRKCNCFPRFSEKKAREPSPYPEPFVWLLFWVVDLKPLLNNHNKTPKGAMSRPLGEPGSGFGLGFNTLGLELESQVISTLPHCKLVPGLESGFVKVTEVMPEPLLWALLTDLLREA